MTRFVRCWWPPVVVAALALAAVAGSSWAGGAKAGGLSKEQEKVVHDALRDVINEGARLFNQNGNYDGCYRVYVGGLIAVKPLLSNHPDLQKTIDSKLDQARLTPSSVQRAYIVREALDAIRDKFGPGESKVTPPPVTKDKTLTITVPAAPVKIKQGEKQNVKVDVKRGKDLKEDISVKVQAPKGLAATVKDNRLGPQENSAILAITAAKDAAPGVANVTLTASGGGSTASVVIKVEIEKAVIQQPPPPKKTEVSGKITLNGKPLGNVQIHFVGDKNKKASSQPTGQDGAYKIDQGLTPGKYRIEITPAKVAGLPKANIPKNYQDASKSGLTAQVLAGAQTVDLALKGAAPKPKDPPQPPANKDTVSGKVTYKGKPLPYGQVHFFSGDGKKFAAAPIKDGTYALDKALPPGKYRVAITVVPNNDKQPKLVIPERYLFYTTSPIMYEARQGGAEFNLDLTD